MPEFLQLIPPVEALNILLKYISPITKVQIIETSKALGRVTSTSTQSDQCLPNFNRSTVDGFAVVAESTFGASESLPAYMHVVGEVLMGEASSISITPEQCALIHTGGMLPENANAVVMLEHTQSIKPTEIEVYKPVGVGENVIHIGEDIRPGEIIVQEGMRLRPADIAGLMALGITKVCVRQAPRIGIISTGDEVIPPDNEPQFGQVRDINSYSLSALVEKTGGIAILYGIVKDDPQELYTIVMQALRACDALVISAGSSASARDLTAQVINRLGKPGVLVHGINVKPGKPTILGVCTILDDNIDEAGNKKTGTQKAVIGLPGNPVSVLVIANLFLVPLIRALLGEKHVLTTRVVSAQVNTNIPSQAGREDWIPVCLLKSPGGLLAQPIYGQSNLIFTLVKADGFICIPPDMTGLSAGEMVEVILEYL